MLTDYCHSALLGLCLRVFVCVFVYLECDSELLGFGTLHGNICEVKSCLLGAHTYKCSELNS